ncbi:MAG: hypothetical protein M3Y85_00680 [Bacteroidota bacterium]|nr:hypothetical protein [Bacteroidota bacterium]
MKPTKNNEKPQQGQHQNPLPNEISEEQRSINESAHNEAEKDMEKDADLSVHSENDDLDEGEAARLGEDLSKII